jgi:hypothetical protein
MELMLKGILHANDSFQGEKRLMYFPIVLCTCIEETHESLTRKPSRLEAAAFSPLFPCENRVSF